MSIDFAEFKRYLAETLEQVEYWKGEVEDEPMTTDPDDLRSTYLGKLQTALADVYHHVEECEDFIGRIEDYDEEQRENLRERGTEPHCEIHGFTMEIVEKDGIADYVCYECEKERTEALGWR
ncbi:MAG: hypothetical protein ACK456_10120 [Pseudanabaenaceae cyanobacterium]|jgi:hypothetical protein